MYKLRLRQSLCCMLTGLSLLVFTSCQTTSPATAAAGLVSLPVKVLRSAGLFSNVPQILETEKDVALASNAPEFVIHLHGLTKAENQQLHEWVQANNHDELHKWTREQCLQPDSFSQGYFVFESVNEELYSHVCINEVRDVTRAEFDTWFKNLFLEKEFYHDASAWDAQAARVNTLRDSLANKIYAGNDPMTLYSLHKGGRTNPFTTYVGLSEGQGIVVIVEHVL